MPRILLGTVAGWVAYTVLQALTGGLLLRALPAPPEGAAVLFLAANLLTVSMIVALASRAMSRGWQRVLTLLVIPWGISANSFLEAAFFSLDIPRPTLLLLLVHGFVCLAGLALVVDRVVPSNIGDLPMPPRRSLGSWIARIAACDLAYIAAYIGAGLVVWPFVKDFYAARPLPAMGAVVAMQVARGLVFTGIVALMVRRQAGSPMIAALLAGVALAVLGGIAPLMVPNPFMPAAIRLPHMVETGVSMLLWGFAAALILARGKGGGAEVSSAAA
jgi:hypothetical protein